MNLDQLHVLALFFLVAAATFAVPRANPARRSHVIGVCLLLGAGFAGSVALLARLLTR